MRVTIKLKLAMAFAAVILLLMGTAAYGIMSLGNLNQSLSDVLDGPAKRLQLSQMLNIEQLQMIRQQKNVLTATSGEEIASAVGKGDSARKDFDGHLTEVEALATEQGKALWAQLRVHAAEFRKHDDQIRDFVRSGNASAALQLSTGAARTVTNDIDKILSDVAALELSRLEAADAGAEAQYVSTRTIMLAVTGVAFIIAIAAALWISVTLSKGLQRAVTSVREVSEGDLTKMAEITNRDEVGELLGHVNIMIERLRGVVGDALAASDNVSSGS
ncbi:MCP four helix bundle domain-containing protein, partial [Rhizobium sp. LjRoot30]|uniref:MCP four helix bundle domain-containing protein n=1 Tax=Rhizobium sp. LjRoot30 TaxID=3342320 RepID=UPI003F508613